MGKDTRVAIAGGGQTRFGERAATWRELVQEAGVAAFSSLSGIGPKDIDGLFVGAGLPGILAEQAHVAPLVAEMLGLINIRHMSRVEMACASGQAALRHAYMAVASGMCEMALCVGVEKMCIPDRSRIRKGLAVVLDKEWDAAYGANAPPFFAMVAQRHMHEFGTTREHLSAVAIKNRGFAASNPEAHFQDRVTGRDVEESPTVSPPLRLLDCCPISDGAAAALVVSGDRARALTDTPVWVRGLGQAARGNAIAGVGDIIRWDHLRTAVREALRMARLGMTDIDMAEVHDCFTISEIIIAEEFGLCKKGDGGPFVADGGTGLGGALPMNTRGGLLGMGHPLGATGISQTLEVLHQVRGDVPKERAVGDVGNAIVHNLSGAANVHSVMVLGRDA